MKTLTRRTVGVALLACVALTSCKSYQTTPADVIAPNSPLRVEFSEPTDLVLLTADGDSLPMSNVIELYGTLVARNTETTTVVVSRAQQMQPFGNSELTSASFSSPLSARLALSDNARLLTRQMDSGATVVVTIVAIPVAYGLLLAVLSGFEGMSWGK